MKQHVPFFKPLSSQIHVSLMSIQKPSMDISKFPSQKRAIFRKIEEIKELRGDVPRYVAQEIPQIDKEIAEKGRFRTETSLILAPSPSTLFHYDVLL